MNTTPTSGSDPLQTLAKSIFQNFDRTGDGKLDSSEFFAFISQLVGRIGGATVATGATGAALMPAATQPLSRLGGDLEFAGFNFERAQNPERSGKDAFAMLAKQSGWMPRTKQDAESWFNTHIKPGMEQLGYTVHWVKGDKAQITVREGTHTIDFLARADGDNPMLQWLVIEQ